MLQGDGAENLAVGLPLEAFLRLERRLQPIRPVAIDDNPAGQFVDDRDAAVPHDVVDIAPQEHVRMERAVELGQQPVVVGAVEAANAQRALGLFDTRVSQFDVPAVLVGVEMGARGERRDQRREPRGARGLAPDASRNHQGHARLVDEQRVGFVDEREVERPMNEQMRDPSPADRGDDRIPLPWP